MDVCTAFLFGGIICTIVQFIFRVTKLPVPKLLALCLGIGGVLTLTGWMDHITGLCRSGMILMIIDSGEAVYRWTESLLNGNPTDCIRYLCLLLFSFSLGIGGGILYHKRITKNNTRTCH